MSIIITTQAIVLIHLSTVSTQFMPPSYSFYPQQPPMMPMQAPHMNPMPPMPLPMPFPMAQRLPMVVMPHHSKSADKKTHKKRKRIRVESSSDESSSGEADFRARKKVKHRGKKRHQVLTPVISYVTKDGYVVYQKKIKKEKAKDWLEMNKDTEAFKSSKRSSNADKEDKDD